MLWKFKEKKNTFLKTKKIDFEGKKIDFKLEGEIVYFVNLHINFNIFKLEVKMLEVNDFVLRKSVFIVLEF